MFVVKVVLFMILLICLCRLCRRKDLDKIVYLRDIVEKLDVDDKYMREYNSVNYEDI